MSQSWKNLCEEFDWPVQIKSQEVCFEKKSASHDSVEESGLIGIDKNC